MKFELSEHDGCFAINMTAETIQDAATLVRLGMNTTRELRSLSASVNQAGVFEAFAVFAKHKRASQYIPRRK
jgi:hypothetical protein